MGLCVQVPSDDKGECQIPAAGVPGGWEPPCGCWELGSGPLWEQPVVYTA